MELHMCLLARQARGGGEGRDTCMNGLSKFGPRPCGSVASFCSFIF